MTLGNLLIDVIRKLNVEHVFGVPGDYNLRFLDYIVEDSEIKWVGNCNELNGGYSADGYARENGVGVVLTTSGVGELSAANAIAGSFAHNIPVLHIVGYPNSRVIDRGIPVHHTLANFQKNSFLESFKSICGATTILTEFNYLDEIQRVILNMLTTKKPSYIGIPSDLVDMKITNTIKEISFHAENGDTSFVSEIGDEIIKRYSIAKKPIMFLGIDTVRFGWRDKMLKILQKTNAKFATSLMGKTIINTPDMVENYLGIYAGEYSTDGMAKLMQNSDCIISIGAVQTDVNSGGFTEYGIDHNNTITLKPKSVKIGEKYYFGVNIGALLDYVLENIEPNRQNNINFSIKKTIINTNAYKTNKNKLNQKEFWNIVAQEIIKEGDIVVAETGSSLLGLLHQNLPPKADLVSQILWSSIGYSLPAAVGTAIACPHRRVLLFIGDGSLQLTVQELSLIARYRLNIVVFVINNSGYTIERAIHGPEQRYNDIDSWEYLNLAKSVGLKETLSIKYFDELIENLNFINKKGPKVIELFFDKLDYPPLLEHLSKKLKFEAGSRVEHL